jgi:SAM-dependent methyltransferase
VLNAVVVWGRGEVYVRGWIRDTVAEATSVSLVTPNEERIDLLNKAAWEGRPLVDAYFGEPGATRARGFSCLAELDTDTEGGTWVVELRDATGGVASAPVDAAESLPDGRQLLLRALVEGPALTPAAAETAVAALERLQLRASETGIEQVHVYGDARRDCDISVVVPVGSNPEFVEHHLAAYAGDPELQGVDLVFAVTWSASLRLLPDASGLHEIYGLPFRIAVLGDEGAISVAAAANAGIRSASGRLLAVAPGGTLPAAPGWLGRLAEAHEAHPDCIVGGTVLGVEGAVGNAGFELTPNGSEAVFQPRDAGLERRTLFPAPHPVDAVAGCVLVSAAALGEVGGLAGTCLDPQSELLALSLRFASAGRQAWCAPAAEFYDTSGFADSVGPPGAAEQYHSRLLGRMSAESREAGPSVWVDELVASPEPPLLSASLRPPTDTQAVGGHGLTVSGHALAADGPVENVIVLMGDLELGRTRPDRPTPRVAEANPEVARADKCGFWVPVSVLGLPERFELDVEAETAAGERIPLGTVRGGRRRLSTGYEPRLQPLFVTTLGRTGSSWLMLLLAQHPELVAYLPFRFEPRVASYWLAVARALAEPRSYLQTIEPRLFAGHWWLGDHASPTRAAAAGQRQVPEWLGGANVEAIAGFAQSRIDSFYSEAADSMNRRSARFFAEKRFPNELNDHLAAELFPESKEIFLVRDLRDVACSSLSFGERRGAPSFGRELAASDEEYIQVLRRYGLRILDAWRERGNSSLLVRYEDLIHDPQSELQRIFDYVGIDSSPATIAKVISAARATETRGQEKHQTAASPADSVGRWQRDLPEELKRAARDSLDDILEVFGYPSTRVASPAPVSLSPAPAAAEWTKEALVQVVERRIPAGSKIVTLGPGVDDALAGAGRDLVTLPEELAADELVEQVQAAAGAGAGYLLVPGTALPWLETQDQLYEYLAENARELTWREDAAGIFRLVPPPPELRELQRIRVVRRVSPNDRMYANGAPEYFNFGRAGLGCVRDALELAGRGRPASVLDLPSGHGRVLRFLKAYWPESEIVACDLDRDGVDYCAETFGATPVYSHVRPAEIPLDRTFDAIWVGSLVTHLDAPAWDEFLNFFCDRLSPGGALVFTFSGEHIAERVRSGQRTFAVADHAKLVQDWDEHGFAYQDYVNQESYGISLSHSAWVRSRIAEIPGARVLAIWERGWSGQHDVAVVTHERR